jgi:hypothetical protein
LARQSPLCVGLPSNNAEFPERAVVCALLDIAAGENLTAA